jgi:hypothetical protein
VENIIIDVKRRVEKAAEKLIENCYTRCSNGRPLEEDIFYTLHASAVLALWKETYIFTV